MGVYCYVIWHNLAIFIHVTQQVLFLLVFLKFHDRATDYCRITSIHRDC